ncbi:MAG: inorganic pyrophosphatase [Anaerolineaceae bacterium]|nr:inorganic pyrophosphatase [Anaerolineaceae bacterium]
MNIWHDVSIGPDAPTLINIVVEIPHNTRNKYELDHEHGFFRLDRVLNSSLHYAADYGLIPQTLYDDGDPLDALILLRQPTFPGCVITGRPIGIFRMLDQGASDDKILTVPEHDPIYLNYGRLENVPQQQLEEIAHFFAHYKDLEKKNVEIVGWESREVAHDRIRHAQALYKNR